MKIVGIEEGQILKLIQVMNDELPVPQTDQPPASQVLKGTVDVHSRQAEQVRQLRLGQGQVAGLTLRQPDQGLTKVQFAEEMTETFRSRAPAEADGVFPFDRDRDQQIPP